MSIPRVFHFVFGLRRQREPFHLLHYLCLASCLSVNEPDEVLVHLRHEPHGPYWDALRGRITPVPLGKTERPPLWRYRDALSARYRYAHQADFARLDILAERGGVYADMDTLFVAPLPDALFEHPAVVGRERAPAGSNASLCNALIMAEPGSGFVQRWRAELARAFNGSWSAHSTLLPHRLSAEHPESVHIEPERSFYPHAWTPEGVATLFERLDPDLDGVLSMHLWAHLWWKRSRRDVSHFHAGLLDEDYVRAGATTYALAARQFLP